MTILDYLQYEDLTPDMQLVSENLGLDVVKTLIEQLGGITVHIPRHTILLKTAKRFITENPNMTAKQYAVTLALSETTIARLLATLRNNKS